jgi:hypothetical protein
MFGGKIMRRVLSFSLALACAIAWAGPYQAAAERLKAAQSIEQKKRVLKTLAAEQDLPAALETQIKEAIGTPSGQGLEKIEGARRTIDLYSRSESRGNPVEADSARAKADAIKVNNRYKDLGEQQQSNWLVASLNNLLEFVQNLLGLKSNRPDLGRMNASPLGIDPKVVAVICWSVIGLVLGAFVLYAVRHFAWKGRLKRKRTAVLEDDEPERTLDEWLIQADLLASQGKFREAVRALYLACLLKFDERGIARFLRGETNWEHLARIQASPKRPVGLEFVQATQLFDQVWYGFRVKGMSDVDALRAWYVEICERTGKAAA